MSSETLYERLTSSRFFGKIAKYSIGSVIALGTSTVVFELLLLVGSNNTTIDSIAAFVAGAVPNWILNRRWAWQQTGDMDVLREIVGYTIVSVIALAASSLGTGLMQDYVQGHVAANSGLRSLLVTGAYVLVQALLFVVKFVIYDRWVFTGESRFRAAWRSRRQVLKAARANRTP
ncbi:GtrA family protein [Conexibacter sp. DBS9H8]|uniref:GtrA family protein n=1 Tax=Conexibacter sp. DBS9H8 TaxID=2937801 RepID=UPI0020106EB4|nr:GtrA family protein [Conexibacter sp. DBS9H8]